MVNNTPISQLPIAISLAGSEMAVIDQAGTTKTATISLINAANPQNVPAGGITGQALVKSSNVDYAATWQTVPGAGTVQSVASGAGLTGGPITLTGTLSLAPVSTGTVLANTAGSTAAPTPTAPSSILDVIGSTQGDILYRSASGWLALPPGTNGQILVSGGAAANPSWGSTGSGSVTSVGLSLPSIMTVSGSPVTVSGTLTAALATQAANLVWAGPTTGAAAQPTFRSLVGADLPNPSATTLGGIQSTVGAANEWISSISTSGIPALTRPAFSNISGSVAASQLPNPTASTLGGVQSYAAVSNQWINQISTSGVPSSTQPSFSAISGSATLAQLPSIGNNTVVSNISGGSSTPLANSLSMVIDSAIGSTQGDVLYRGASTWSVLAPGTSGQVLSTGGAAANPSWTTVTGTGTVTSVGTNNGLTGGPVTSSGNIGLATIATGNVLANTSGGSAVPTATTPSSILDVIGSTQGDILYRGASSWAALTPGTNGQFLQTTAGGSTPVWATALSSAGTGLTATGSSVAISVPVAVANGGTGDTGTAWTSYTPTVTALAGTFATVSATGRYKTLGKTVFIQMTITVTSVGTASGGIQATLPGGITAAAFGYQLAGAETQNTGKACKADILASATSVTPITYYDNSFPGASGNVVSISGVFEST